MVFPFEKHLSDNLRTYLFIITYINITTGFHHIDSKNLPGEFYATTVPGFWKLSVIILLKMCLVIFQKMYCQQCPFSLQQMLLLISRISPIFIQEITVFDERRLFKKLQDQLFKNSKKWMLAYKEWRGNLDNCSSPYLDIINQRSKYPHLFIKWVIEGENLPLISCLFIMSFNFGYVHIISSGLNKCIYQK